MGDPGTRSSLEGLQIEQPPAGWSRKKRPSSFSGVTHTDLPGARGQVKRPSLNTANAPNPDLSRGGSRLGTGRRNFKTLSVQIKPSAGMSGLLNARATDAGDGTLPIPEPSFEFSDVEQVIARRAEAQSVCSMWSAGACAGRARV
jgi:hypothetical protein